MASAPTQAEFRDLIRRWLQLVPAVDDTPPGPVGDPSPSCPDPNNAMINQAINSGIGFINRSVRTGPLVTYQMPVPLGNIHARGPQYLDYSGSVPDALTASEVENAVFTDSIVTNRLEPFAYYSLGRDYVPYQSYAPGVPTQLILSGSQIGILPPSATAGTVYFDVATSIPPLLNNTDQIAYLPVSYQMTVTYFAVAILSARQATNVEAIQRYQTFLPLATQGLVDIYTWKNGYDAAAIQTIRDTTAMIPLAAAWRQVEAAQAVAQPPGPQNGNRSGHGQQEQ